MRILAIDSSSVRGSVALVEDGRILTSTWHDRPNAHGENLLPLIEQLLDGAGWQRAELNRVAVGKGPGSFTGLRVGIALGQGIALGLGIPMLGVSSLQAMAHGVPDGIEAPLPEMDRCAIIDARRGELFVAVFTPEGRVREPPRCIPRKQLIEHVNALPQPSFVLGDVVRRVLSELAQETDSAVDFDPRHRALHHSECDFPSAGQVGRLATKLAPESEPVTPDYLRDADATLPNLPTSPLSKPRRTPA